MLPITFLSHLSPDVQQVIAFFLKDEGSPEQNMALIQRVCPDVAPNCEVYISYSNSLAALNLPDNDKNLIRTIIGAEEIPSASKILCIEKVFEHRDIEALTEFRTQTSQFLSYCMPFDTPPLPIIPKHPRIPVHPDIPVEESFPILDEIDSSFRVGVKDVLSKTSLEIHQKFAAIKQIVTKQEELTLLKRYLKDKDVEAQLLSRFSEDVRGELAAVFREKSLTFHAKMNLLKHILPKPQDRTLCRDHLIAQKQAEKQQREAIRFLKSFEEDEEKMNILILGESGVGKSTFVNGLANYLKFLNLHDAKARGPEILISTRFTQWAEGQRHTINYPADDDHRNENLEAGQSSTQDPKFYKFYGENLLGKYREINVLDTPGIGDVKGMEKDGENFEKIFSRLADWEELHAILILLKPNQSRLTECMTYCLGELFGRLNKNCAANIIFCCTNTRSHQYTPGDTYETLEVLLKEIEVKWGVEIPCHRQQVFSFDNESFRFLCASQQIQFDEQKTSNYNLSWMNSVSEMFRLFTRINNLTPCKTNHTLKVFNVRTAINTLLSPLDEVQKQIRALERVIDDNEATKARLHSEQVVLLPKRFFIRFYSIRRPMQSSRIDMVCSTCGAFDKHNPTEKHYKLCHQDCKCPETSTARLNTTSEVLVQKCQCFDQETFKCKECGCPYQSHMKTEKELVHEKKLDKTVDGQIKLNIRKLQDVVNVLAQKIREKSDLEAYVRFLENAINQLGVHLKNSCLLPYNLYVNGYVLKEIESLKMQGSDNTAATKIAKLRKLQDEYEQLVRIVDQIETEESTETVDSIISKIRKGASRSLREHLTNMASFNVRSGMFNRITSVDIGQGWMGKLRANLY